MEDRIVISTNRAATRQCLACGALYTDRSTRFCIICLRSGTIGPAVQRPADTILPTPKAVTARELLRTQYAVFSPKAYPTLRLAPGCVVALYSGPGGGKSTFALLLANSLEPSAYLALEERIGAGLSSKCAFLELHSEQLTFYEPTDIAEISSLASRPGLRCLVIDSINMTVLQAADVLRIARSNNIVCIIICQCTKEGKPRGSLEYIHLADVVIRVESLRWELEKSRYQQAGIGGPVT